MDDHNEWDYPRPIHPNCRCMIYEIGKEYPVEIIFKDGTAVSLVPYDLGPFLERKKGHYEKIH